LVYNPLDRGAAPAASGRRRRKEATNRVLESYLPVLVFAGLGIVVGGAFVLLNGVLGPRRPNPIRTEPYECGLPTHVTRTFRFGVSFYMVAMLFILFDIEVVFLYPVGAIVQAAESVFVLVEVGIFVLLLLVALVFVWARGALDWR
jgi:NADH-quinone oxidoreductase subunit A